MKTNQDFKNAALAALKGNWANAVLATILLFLVVFVIAGPNVYQSLKNPFDPNAGLNELLSYYQTMGSTSSLVFLAEIFLLYPLSVGFVNAFRKLLVRQDTNLVRNAFDFSNYWKKVGTMLLRYILTSLWLLLFIVPGIIKSFSYAMTPYIIDEYPELSPSEAIHRSRMMMKGHKFDLFWLYLSFIGWFILAAFTFGIGYLWLAPYAQTAEAAFYEEVKADYALKGGLD